MTKVIAICNQKGGTGKTTSAINLSTCLALADRRVLLIDIDPQANATTGLGIDKNKVAQSTYNVLLDQILIPDIIVKTQVPNLHLAPSNLALSGAEVELVGLERREHRLRLAINIIRNSYDYIFIDSPPSLGLLTVNALTASNSILIPLQCEYYALEGIGQLLNTIDLVKRNLNSSLEIEGLLLTMADYRTRLTSEVIGELRSFFKEKVYQTVIPRNIRLSEAPGFGRPVILYDRESVGAQKYLELSREILNGEQEGEGARAEEDAPRSSVIPPAQNKGEGQMKTQPSPLCNISPDKGAKRAGLSV